MSGSPGSCTRFCFRSLSCSDADGFCGNSWQGVMLGGEGSGCSVLVFVSLDIVRSWQGCRRVLLREESCRCSSRYHRLLALSVAAHLFGRFVLLDARLYRLEGEGVASWSILLLGLTTGRKSPRLSAKRGGWVINALEFQDEISQQQPLLFLSFCERSIPPPGILTSETSPSRECRSQAGSGQRWCCECRLYGDKEG